MRHLPSKINTTSKGLCLCGTRGYQSRDGLASIGDRDFVPFSDLGNEGGKVLPGFTDTSFFHGHIVLHVALLRNCGHYRPFKRSSYETRISSRPSRD